MSVAAAGESLSLLFVRSRFETVDMLEYFERFRYQGLAEGARSHCDGFCHGLLEPAPGFAFWLGFRLRFQGL